VPTHDQVLVPETLLKKRKSQEKAREERAAELEKKKKVSHNFPDWYGRTIVMHNIQLCLLDTTVSMLSLNQIFRV
jgi:hypothetical protein